MAFVPLLLGAAGAGIQFAGQLEQGKSEANMANYRSQVAANNAVIANANAEHAVNAGITKAAATSMKGAAVAGRIRAAQSANNIDVHSGSAADVAASQREVSKLDTETVLSNAQLEAYGYRSAATSYTAESELDTAQGKQAKTASEIGAVGSLLSNASSLAGKWGGGGGGTPGGGSTPYSASDYATAASATGLY